MHEPRSPETHEMNQVLEFLDHNLRQDSQWTIASEYPTALAPHNIHNMSIISHDEKIISHAVLKPLIVKSPHVIYKVGAIGSVVTDSQHREQGHSTKNIENCLQKARAQDCDLAILWTDQFDFYRKFGFELAGYDFSYVFENEQQVMNKNLRFNAGNNIDPQALLKLYSTHTVHAVRTLEDFRQFLKIPQSNVFTAWDQNNQLMAYAAEGKGIDLINYIHEWGGQTEALMDLFRYIRAHKKEAITVMVPSHSKSLKNQLSLAANVKHKGYLGMLKIVNSDSLFTKIKKAFRAEGFEKIVLEKQNDNYILGLGADLYNLKNESDLIQLLFGPLEIKNLDFMSADTQQKLSHLLPLPLWIWGWDSI
jgi:predicted acetyltransferase